MSQKFTGNRNYFHTFSKVGIKQDLYVFQAKVKGGHNIASNEVRGQQHLLPAAQTFAQLQGLYNANANQQQSIMKLYKQAVMTPVFASNNQAWEVLDGGKRVKDFIAPTDVLDSTGNPCLGYDVHLYTAGGQEKVGTQGSWVFDPYSGLIIFQTGYDPITLGWCTADAGIKLTAFAYVGKTVKDLFQQQSQIAGVTYEEIK